MTSVPVVSSASNDVDQYRRPQAPHNNHKQGATKNSRSRNDCPSSATPATSSKRDNEAVNAKTSAGHRRSSRSEQDAESIKSMKEISSEAKDQRRRRSEMEVEDARGNDDLSHRSRRRSNQDNRGPRDGSVSSRRSRNSSPSGEDRISTVSSNRRRSSVSRNPETDNRRASKNIEPEGDEILTQRSQYRHQDRKNSDQTRRRRPSHPHDPDFTDPPGQIRPSRRYDSSGQHQKQPRHSSHYSAEEQDCRAPKNDCSSYDRAERVRSTRPPEPHQDPPGHIRRSSMHRNSDSSQGQRQVVNRERYEPEAPSRRHSMRRSDSTGGDSCEGRQLQHRKPRCYGDREADQATSSGDTYREVRRSQSRHSGVKRSSLSRSSSVEKSSDVEIEYRNREERAARIRDKRNEEEAILQEQRRKTSKVRANGSQVNIGPDAVEGNGHKQSNVVESNKHSTNEDANYPERTRRAQNEVHRHRRSSSSLANEDRDYDSLDSRQSTSSGRGHRHNQRTRYRAYDAPVHTDERRRRSSRSSRGDLDGEIPINTADSQYDLEISQDSSYSIVSQVSKQYNQPQASRSTSRHEIRVEDDNCPTDRAQAAGHRRIHGRSSNRRRSVCCREDGEGQAAVGTTSRPEGHHSRRSSSSKSNQDTGFASSPSTPRREDSQTRFSSDASLSRHGINDDGKHHRMENGRRRRRSNLVPNKSLDVPGVSLRKEQSLSSSGRGDSSFEDPVAEHYVESRKNRNTSGIRNEDGVSNSTTFKSVEDINRNIDTVSESNITAEIPNVDNIASKDVAVSSSVTSCSSTTLNKESCESAKALSSSTSTLKGAPYTSKASIAGSISSLFGRNSNDGLPAQSVSDRWRKLKQDMMPEKNSKSFTDTGKEKAAAIFSAAAAKFMTSFPGVSAAFPNMPVPKTDTSRDGLIPKPGSESTDDHVKENGVITQTLVSPEEHSTEYPSKGGSVSRDTSHTKLVVPSKAGDGTASLQTPTVVSSSTHTKPGASSSRVSTTSLSNMSVPGRTPTVSPSAARRTTPSSQRPSIVSTELSSHERRANVYAAMTERASDGSDSEDSGEMTPPPMDTEMKRKSKEVDMELTSFLPAEMSRREEKFHDAARVNDASAIRALLREKVGVNCRNSLDRTALHWAAANGNLEAVEALVEGGADLEAKDKYGMRAVLWSAWFGHIPVLRALVNAGASTRVTNKQGLGVLHCAAENNHVNIIAFIFDNLEPHDVNQIDKNERTPLHSAAEGGHVDAVNKLLECKADLHKKDKVRLKLARNEGGMTSVHLAAKHGNIDVLKALLLQGVEVDDRDVEGKSAVHLAAEAGHKDAVDLLLDYTANPNSETVKEITPLHLAAIEGHVEVCKSLVKYGCNVNAQNFQGNTALHLAANGNHKEVARVLVEAKCELDLPNSRLQTPLHVAVESGHLNVVQILLAGGASMETREKSGKSALQLAARGNYVAVVDMLIKAERYYANTRDYHDKDVGYVDPDTYLRKAQHPHSAQMKEILWKLATKQLKPTDWKKLAYHWNFTPEHVRAIEQEYTGTTSYREHSYRLLIIWLHGVRKDENVIKLLFEALVAIDRKHLAESVRRKVNMTMNTNIDIEKPCSPAVCAVS